MFLRIEYNLLAGILSDIIVTMKTVSLAVSSSLEFSMFLCAFDFVAGIKAGCFEFSFLNIWSDLPT